MKTRSCCVLFGMLTLAVLAPSRAETRSQLPLPTPVLHLPHIATPPTVDGVIGGDEWAGAARITGFMTHGQKAMLPAELQPVWWIAWDDANLYFAQRFVLYPRGTIIARTKQGDRGGSNPDAGPRMVFEDHVEIQIATNTDRRAVLGDHFYKLVINPYGAVEDARRCHNVGWAGLEWESAAKVGSKVADECWTLEVALPLKSLGFDGPPADGTPLLMQLVSSADPEQFYAAWVPGSWLAWDTFPTVVLDRRAPAVRIESLGEPMSGALKVEIALHSAAGQARKAQAHLTVTDTGNREVFAETRTLQADADGRARTDFAKDALGLTPPDGLTWAGYFLRQNPANLMALSVTDERGQRIFEQTWRFTLRPADLEESFLKPFAMRRQVVSEPSVSTAYMPYYDRIEVHVDTAILGLAERYKAAAGVNVRIMQALWSHQQGAAERAGLVFLNETAALPADGTLSATFAVPKLDPGQYIVVTRLLDKAGKELFASKEELRRYKYAWEHNTIGLASEAIPPFLPIRRKGNDLTLWGRTYRFAETGLPSAMVSAGADMLAGTPELTARIDGRDCKLEPLGKIAWRDASTGLVLGEAASRLGPLPVSVRTRTEYDGMLMIDLTLLPERAVTVQDMTLRIRLPAAVARDWFIMGPATDMYANVGGVPDQPGVFWDSNRLRGTASILGTFVPYLYLGDGEKGLCYAAASDQGRILDFKSPADLMERTRDTVDLVLRLANTERQVEKPRTITFGLQAVPVKPLPAGYRAKGFGPWTGPERGPAVQFRTGYGGTNLSCWGLGSGTDQWTMKDDLEYDILREQVLAAKRATYPNYDLRVIKYVPTNVLGLGNDGWATYGGEWTGRTEVKPQPHPGYNKLESPFGRLDEAGGTRQFCDLTQSSVDFRVWAFDQLQRRCGLNGLWWDHSQFWSSGNLNKGSAYVTDDGRVQGTLNLFLFRQLMKRLAVVSYLNAVPFEMGQYAPGIMASMSFGTYNWAIEGPWYPQPGQSILHEFDNSLQKYRTLCGRWTGLPTIVANRIHGDPPPDVLTMQARSCIGLTLLHDVPQETLSIPPEKRKALWPILDGFGWFDDRTEWVPYWRSQGLLSVQADQNVVATAYRNAWSQGGPRALVVLFNAGDGPAKAVFAAKDALLGRPARTVSDAEEGKAVAGPLGIPRHDYRLLIVE